MTILFAGGEMGAFIPSDSTVIETTSGYNSDFARCMIKAQRSSNYAETATIAATADLWLHFEMVQGNSAFAAGTWLTLYDTGGTGRIRVRSGGDNTTLYMDYWNGTAWTEVDNFAISMNDLQTFDIHVVSNTATGSAKLYVAGTLRIESGTLDLSAFTGITKARFTGRTTNAVSAGPSQVIMADESTIGWRLKTVPATGAGASTAWTGGYTEIDEITYSDADFINSATADQVELFTHSTTVPDGYTVRGVAVTARAKRGTTGPQNMRLMLRSGGTTYDNGADLALDEGYGAFCAVWETDPATSADFTASAIASLQFGVKSIT
jgi:hypothetical protein